MLLLGPAIFSIDILITLKNSCEVPLAELFTMLKRAGASQIITYTAASLAAALG